MTVLVVTLVYFLFDFCNFYCCCVTQQREDRENRQSTRPLLLELDGVTNRDQWMKSRERSERGWLWEGAIRVLGDVRLFLFQKRDLWTNKSRHVEHDRRRHHVSGGFRLPEFSSPPRVGVTLSSPPGMAACGCIIELKLASVRVIFQGKESDNATGIKARVYFSPKKKWLPSW